MRTRKSLEQSAGVRLTERDHRIVNLVCEQGAISAEDLGIFMASDAGNHALGQRTRNGVLARLGRVGLVTSARWSYQGAAAVYPTRLGASWVGWDGRVDPPGFGVLKHELTAAAVRVGSYPTALGWRFACERRIQLDDIDYGHRRPDGIATLGSRRTAVEVQLSVTDQPHITSVLFNHLDHFESVDYWCLPGPASLVARVVSATLSSADSSRVLVRDLGGLAR